jgi:hypothetical protein
MTLRAVRSGSPKLVAACVVALTIACVPEVRSQSAEPPPTGDKPIVEVDLHKFGYERYRNTHAIWPTFLDFIDIQNLALAWMTPDDRTAAAKTGILTPTPAHLHVLLLDAVTGQKKGLQDWPAPSSPIRFFGARDGKFLTCTGNVLRLISSNFSVLQEKGDLHDQGCAAFSSREVGVSPSRQTLALSYPSGKNRGTTLLRIDKFSVVADWIDQSTINDISDHWLVGRCGETRQVCIRGIDHPWQPFYLPGLSEQVYRSLQLRFVNDETLAVTTGNKMSVVTVGANTVFQAELANNELFGKLATSTGSERFAVMENRLRGLRSEPLDMYPFPANERVVVYSIPDRRAIYSVKVKGTSPWTPWYGHLNQFALSSEGTLLAVVCDEVLRVYRLPKA